jgi:hypothetical protein
MTVFRSEKLAPLKKTSLPTWMVFAVDNDHRTPIYRTMRHDETSVEKLAEQIAGCEECQRQYLDGVVGPRHTPSSRCTEGSKPHCKCPACY